MPYPSNAALPASLRNHLPPHAQDLYREAFNAAWATQADDVRREEVAHRIAWAAVKRQFHKGGDGQWLERNEMRWNCMRFHLIPFAHTGDRGSTEHDGGGSA